MPAENPYKPPAAPVRDPPRPPRSPTQAVFVGIGVYLGGTLASSAVVAMLFTLVLVVRGRDAEEFDPRQPVFGFISFFTGGACSLLGGYVCARLARRNERRVTAIMASLSAAVPVAFVLVVALQYASLPVLSLGWSGVRLVLMFLLAIAGGELGRRRNLANAREADAAAAMAA